MNPHGFPHDGFRVEHVCSLIPSRIRVNLVISKQLVRGQDYHYAAVSTGLVDTALDNLIAKVEPRIAIVKKPRAPTFSAEQILLETNLIHTGAMSPLDSVVFEAWADRMVEEMNENPLVFLMTGFKGFRQRTVAEILMDFDIPLPIEEKPKKGRGFRWAFWRRGT